MNKRVFRYAATLAGIIFLSFSILEGAGRINTGTKEPDTASSAGSAADEITFTDMEGNLKRLSDYRGKTVMLNFWATWCPPCRYEKPFMQEIYQDYKDKGFTILALSVGEQKKTVKDYINRYGYTYPVFLDSDGTAFKRYDRSGGIPQTFIIDSRGGIRSYISGARRWTDTDNRRLIEDLLNN